MNKNFFGIFIAQQSTTYENIREVIKKYSENTYNSFIFIDQSNIYNNNLKNVLKLNPESIFRFKKPLLKVVNPYSPSYLVKFVYFIKIKFLLSKIIQKADFVCFSPGGFIEGEIARLVKNNGGKVVQIEGGQPIDAIINAFTINKNDENLFFYKLPFRRFKNNPRVNPTINIDYFITSGSNTKKMYESLGYEKNKILDIGLPRYKELMEKKTKAVKVSTKVENIFYIAGAYEFHNQRNQSNEMISDILEISKTLALKKEIKFYVKPHPRQSSDELKLLSNLNELKLVTNEIFNDMVFKNSIVLNRYSNLAFELMYLNIPTFFFKPPILKFGDNNFPNKELIINNVEELNEMINNFKNINFSKFSNNFFSPSTSNSAHLINNLLLGLNV